MRRPRILSGIVLACGLGLLVMLLESLLWWFWVPQSLFRSTLISSQMIYILYLLRVVRPKIGALTLIILNLAAALSLLTLPLSEGWLLLVWALFMSLTRIVLLHRRLIPAGLDFLTALTGVLLFAYLFEHGGTLSVAVWGFFVVQAAAGMIPAQLSSRHTEEPPMDPFQVARRQAKSAIQEILVRGEG